MANSHCDSSALIAYLAGDTRIAESGATFLLHNVECDPTGRPTAAALRSGAHAVDQVDQAIVNLICARCKYYQAWQVRSEMEREVVLAADAAALRGIVTSIQG